MDSPFIHAIIIIAIINTAIVMRSDGKINPIRFLRDVVHNENVRYEQKQKAKEERKQEQITKPSITEKIKEDVEKIEINFPKFQNIDEAISKKLEPLFETCGRQ